MEISTNILMAVSYGTVGCIGTMAAANAALVGVGAGAKAGAFVADYFKNESVAQNLRIKGDQLFSLAGKYAATELKLAAALAAVGGSTALAQHMMDNQIPQDNQITHDNPILQNNSILRAENNKISDENEEPLHADIQKPDENAKKVGESIKETYEKLGMCLNQERTFITKEQEAYFRAHLEYDGNRFANEAEILGTMFLQIKTLFIAVGIHNFINPMKRTFSFYLEPDYSGKTPAIH